MTTAPSITTTRLCQTTLAMTPPNPQARPYMEDPLPPLSSICLLKSSPRRSQPPLAHTPGYLDLLLPLPMLQYPLDQAPLPPTISSPLAKCPLTQSIALSPPMPSNPMLTSPSLTGSSSLQKHAPTATTKSWPPKKKVTRRSWMTSTKPSSLWRPILSATSTPSPNPQWLRREWPTPHVHHPLWQWTL